MRKLPPLGTLRAFEAAARYLSFRSAANELGVTPTAISHQIRQLEEICGQRLFRRRPPPLALTEHGANLFPVLREGLDRFAAAMACIAPASKPTPPLRITTTNAFAHRWLVPRLPLWRDIHPEVTLDVIGTDAVIDLPAGEADIAIRYQRSPPIGLLRAELFRDTFWPMGSPDLLAAAPIHRPADLRRHTLIHLQWQPSEPSPPTWHNWLQTARAMDFETPFVAGLGGLSFREELHAIEAVIAGQGIAVLSDVLVAPELKRGRLVKALELSLPGFGFYFAHLPDHPRRAVIESFHSWARSVA